MCLSIPSKAFKSQKSGDVNSQFTFPQGNVRKGKVGDCIAPNIPKDQELHVEDTKRVREAIGWKSKTNTLHEHVLLSI